MTRQWSTTLSDAVLASSVIFFVYHVFWVNIYAVVGLSIQGLAAGMGSYRFALPHPSQSVIAYHSTLSWLVQIVGIPLLGIGFANVYAPVMVNCNIMAVVTSIILMRFVDKKMQTLLTEATSGFGMLTVIFVCLRHVKLYGMLGALAYIISGLVIGSKGCWHGIRCVDLLHCALALGNIFFKMTFV